MGWGQNCWRSATNFLAIRDKLPRRVKQTMARNKSRSVTAEKFFEEVRFFGTILWRELKLYQKIAQLTERKKEQARFHA
jgi:hypothetical protein